MENIKVIISFVDYQTTIGISQIQIKVNKLNISRLKKEYENTADMWKKEKKVLFLYEKFPLKEFHIDNFKEEILRGRIRQIEINVLGAQWEHSDFLKVIKSKNHSDEEEEENYIIKEGKETKEHNISLMSNEDEEEEQYF